MSTPAPTTAPAYNATACGSVIDFTNSAVVSATAAGGSGSRASDRAFLATNERLTPGADKSKSSYASRQSWKLIGGSGSRCAT